MHTGNASGVGSHQSHHLSVGSKFTLAGVDPDRSFVDRFKITCTADIVLLVSIEKPEIKTCRKKQHVKIDGMIGVANLICGKSAVGGNYNSTHDNVMCGLMVLLCLI